MSSAPGSFERTDSLHGVLVSDGLNGFLAHNFQNGSLSTGTSQSTVYLAQATYPDVAWLLDLRQSLGKSRLGLTWKHRSLL
jgi:hypothetical protein